MSVIALHMPAPTPDWWLDRLRAGLSEHDVRRDEEATRAPHEIEFAIALKPKPGLLAGYPGLRAIFATSAGVEHYLVDSGIPPVPLIRAIDPEMGARMSEYVLAHVLRHHRQLPVFEAQQAQREWRSRPQPSASEVSVGVLGLGSLGLDVARKLAAVGFKVLGWSRTAKSDSALTTLAGPSGLATVLQASQFLVCLLPMTEETRGILNARAFAQLPKGAVVINAARGGHLIENDLLEALANGQVKAAVLDVFEQEPLPTDHPFWRHPAIMVTPHISTTTNPGVLGLHIAENIRRMTAGLPPLGLVDRARGY